MQITSYWSFATFTNNISLAIFASSLLLFAGSMVISEAIVKIPYKGK